MVDTVSPVGSVIVSSQSAEGCKRPAGEIELMEMAGTGVDIPTTREWNSQMSFFLASEESASSGCSKTALPVSSHAPMVLLPDICCRCDRERRHRLHYRNLIVCASQKSSSPALHLVHTAREAHGRIVADRSIGKTLSRLKDSAQMQMKLNERPGCSN